MPPFRSAGCAYHREEFDTTISVSEWQALVVNEINEEDLLQGAIREPDLPVCMIRFPVDDPSRIAVLSWRWDGQPKHPLQGSKNIFIAIGLAKKLGIQYLFIDVISIDQKLNGDAMLQQVVGFSFLYQTIPVIVAYDIAHAKFYNTIRRPWIASEARLYRSNPTRVIYVGYGEEGQGAAPGPKADPSRSYFEVMLEAIWNETFTETILGLLHEDFGMTSVSDLRYIIPSRARILTAAYEKMIQNDYLLTAAILCQVGREDDLLGFVGTIHNLKFKRYAFRVTNSDSGVSTTWDISLDSVSVATWMEHYKNDKIFHTCRLRAHANAESSILSVLGLSEYDYQGYSSQETTFYRSLQTKANTSQPKLEVFSISSNKMLERLMRQAKRAYRNKSKLSKHPLPRSSPGRQNSIPDHN